MRYTKKQVEYIREISPGRYTNEIVLLFNKRFGTKVSESQIKSFKTNHKIKSNVPRRRTTADDGLFTKKQKDFIKENVKGLLNQELADLVNKKFNLCITVQQIKSWKANNRLSSGLKGSEGMDPPNKGSKGLHNVGGNKTSFKPGQRPLNYKPIGHERIDLDGYTVIKVQDDGPWHKRWNLKHKVIWEKENGPVPEGHALLFLDGDRKNINIGNLILISRKQLAILNRQGLLKEDADLNKLAIAIADVTLKIGERSKKQKG